MLKTHTCYTVACDDCGEDYRNWDEFIPHFDRRTDAEADEYWHEDGEYHLCPACAAKPHAFIADKYSPDECRRCPNPADEHEAAGEGK